MKFFDRQKRMDMMFEEDETGEIRQRYDGVDTKTLSPLSGGLCR